MGNYRTLRRQAFERFEPELGGRVGHYVDWFIMALIGAIVAMLGIGLFALPASILASGFIEQADDDSTCGQYCPHCGEKLE